MQARFLGNGIAPSSGDLINVGVDYADALRFDRRTSLSFGSGMAMMRQGSLGRQYVVDGHAVLTRAISRTWSSSLAYSRGVQYLAAYTQPVLADSVSASVGGQLVTRVQAGSSVNYSRGQIGLTSPASYRTYGASARLLFGLTRLLGMSVQYSYYHYDAPTGLSILPLDSRFWRQEVTVGVQTWLPLYHDRRPPRDPR
jgi:hypothetical protein